MREILFRGKRLDNGGWIKGNPFLPDLDKHPVQICIGTDKVRITYEVDPDTIGEYTGLTDKNGVKIFEGDIVDCYDRRNPAHFSGVVDYADGSFRINDGAMTHYRWMDYECEVISNIYDNPELMQSR